MPVGPMPSTADPTAPQLNFAQDLHRHDAYTSDEYWQMIIESLQYESVRIVALVPWLAVDGPADVPTHASTKTILDGSLTRTVY